MEELLYFGHFILKVLTILRKYLLGEECQLDIRQPGQTVFKPTLFLKYLMLK